MGFIIFFQNMACYYNNCLNNILDYTAIYNYEYLEIQHLWIGYKRY